jgi:hypothetical protein
MLGTLCKVLVVGGLVLLAPGLIGSARACKCLPPTPEDSLRNASAVFEGQVLEVLPVQTPDGATRFEVKLRVVRDFKNAGHEQLTVWTAQDSAACGYAFQVGESHLVYASGDAAPYAVGLCSGTQPMAGADAFLATLGMGEVPVDPAPAPAPTKPAAKPEPPARGGCASCSVGATTRAPEPKLGWLVPGLIALTLTLRQRQRPRATSLPRRS